MTVLTDSAQIIGKHLPISVVADEDLADFIVVRGTNKDSNLL
jgi:hypothetical protein